MRTHLEALRFSKTEHYHYSGKAYFNNIRWNKSEFHRAFCLQGLQWHPSGWLSHVIGFPRLLFRLTASAPKTLVLLKNVDEGNFLTVDISLAHQSNPALEASSSAVILRDNSHQDVSILS